MIQPPQLFSQIAHTLARPAEGRFRIATRHRIHQSFQVALQRCIFRHTLPAPPTSFTDMPRPRTPAFAPPLGLFQFPDPYGDRAARYARRARHGRDATIAEGKTLSGCKQTTHSLIHLRREKRESLRHFLFIRHPKTVYGGNALVAILIS